MSELAEKVRLSRLPAAEERRRIRTDAGVSLNEMAGALGVSPMTVMRWESGIEPRRSNAIAYRELLDELVVAFQEALAAVCGQEQRG